MNTAGFALALLINVGIVWAALNMFLLREGLTLNSFAPRLIVFVVFLGIFDYPIYKTYKVACDVRITKIEERLRS